MCPPVSTPVPYGTDAYAADPPVYGTDPYATDPYATDPYATDPYAYDTDLYAAGYVDGKMSNPYYDTDPVQFAYTPANLPPPTPVVRPERTSPYSRILPRQARQPLYELVAIQRPPIDTTNPPGPSEKTRVKPPHLANRYWRIS